MMKLCWNIILLPARLMYHAVLEVDPSRLYGRSCIQTRLDEPTTSREATVVDAN